MLNQCCRTELRERATALRSMRSEGSMPTWRAAQPRKFHADRCAVESQRLHKHNILNMPLFLYRRQSTPCVACERKKSTINMYHVMR